jgi:hypothetical protein
VANNLDLYVYPNAACAGSPAAASTTLADTVEFIGVASGQPAGTWCAQVTAASLMSTQTFGLAAFTTLAPPALNLATLVDDLTPQPGQDFYIYTTLTNAGSTAPGSYVRLAVPPGFSVDGAQVYTADGRSRYYAASELYTTGDGYWHVATGHAIAGHPRLVRWLVRVEASTTAGAYLFSADAACRCDALLASPAAVAGAQPTYVFVGGQSVYIPLIVH